MPSDKSDIPNDTGEPRSHLVETPPGMKPIGEKPLYQFSGHERFSDWMAALKEHMISIGNADQAHDKGLMDPENWWGYWEDGYRPDLAWEEDQSYD